MIGLLFRLWRYLFPKPKLQQSLPLLPRQFSSPHYPGRIPEHHAEDILFVRRSGLAQNDADAYRLLRRFHKQGLTDIGKIIKLAARQRRPMSRWQRAKKRFKSMF